MLYGLLLMLFVLGTMVGSLLNVCIYRIPLEKSILWPGSRCGNCLQRIRWYDNIPLVSYLVLRGRCRICRLSYSPRYFLIELLTGLLFAGLFYLVVIENVHGFDNLRYQKLQIERYFLPSWDAWLIFGHHAVLISLLVVASFCDLDSREIPLTLTITGTVIGLVVATLFAWPWPWSPEQATRGLASASSWWNVPAAQGPRPGLYPWPFWGPLPAWFAPGGNWQTGLVTGLAGAVAGTVMLRIVRFLFGLGLGVEALGLGDADLMMMAGSFLGWQPVVIAFFVGVFAGLFFGVAQLVLHGDNMMPFGPALAIGIVVVLLGWNSIGPRVQPLFFNGLFVISLTAICCILMLGASYFLRLSRILRQ